MRPRDGDVPALAHRADQPSRLRHLIVERLPAHLEAAGLIRRAEADGGFAMVLRKGDPDRGSIALVLLCRGEFAGLLERVMGPSFEYRWRLSESPASAGSNDLDRLIAARTRLDPDLWLIELDIAEPERFIAETISAG